MRFGDFSGWVPEGELDAKVVNLDGVEQIRVSSKGIHVGYFASVEALIRAGIDLALVKIG